MTLASPPKIDDAGKAFCSIDHDTVEFGSQYDKNDDESPLKALTKRKRSKNPLNSLSFDSKSDSSSSDSDSESRNSQSSTDSPGSNSDSNPPSTESESSEKDFQKSDNSSSSGGESEVESQKEKKFPPDVEDSGDAEVISDRKRRFIEEKIENQVLVSIYINIFCRVKWIFKFILIPNLYSFQKCHPDNCLSQGR